MAAVFFVIIQLEYTVNHANTPQIWLINAFLVDKELWVKAFAQFSPQDNLERCSSSLSLFSLLCYVYALYFLLPGVAEKTSKIKLIRTHKYKKTLKYKT